MNSLILTNQYLEHIENNGYAVIENAIDAKLINDLMADCCRVNPHFSIASIGRLNDQQVDNSIRKDKTYWFDSSSKAQKSYLDAMEDVRNTLNRYFFMGLFDYECHYAKYSHGDFYKKHIDAFRGRTNRFFTTVLYLNSPKEGGELIIYKPNSNLIEVSIKPISGTLVLFESERFVHEVLPAVEERFSVAGWFRKNASISGIVDPPR